MKMRAYDRLSAVRYARRWALGRNPAYADFENMGGDCTNFVSQCLFAGCGVMDFTPVSGWYYVKLNERAPAWSGTVYLHRFLTENRGQGPFGRPAALQDVLPGDVVQWGDEKGRFFHTGLITGTQPQLLVCAHTRDALDRPLHSYTHAQVRFVHVLGAMVDFIP